MSKKILEFDTNYKVESHNKLLNKKTVKIVQRANEIYGLKKCRNVINNYAAYIELKKLGKINFGTYNILINNNSEYVSAIQLVEIIKDLLQAEDIIKTTYKYVDKDTIKDTKKNKKKIVEELIVIDTNVIESSLSSCKKELMEYMAKYPEKTYILVDNERYRIEGLINSTLCNYITWTMKIEKVSKEEKKDYIKKFLLKNNIKLSIDSTFAEALSDEPFWIVMDEMTNVVLECKIKNITEISDEITKNILKRKYYKKNKTKQFDGNALQELEKMIGMKEVKTQVEQIMNYIKVNKTRGNLPMLHMCFLGNPGTGKTTVARIIGNLFSEMKILSDKPRFVEAQRADLIGEYVGQTAPRTKEKVEEADGGVMFIDEAYSISSYIQDELGGDYGAECIATLMKEMEDKRDSLCVILAGYTKEMEHMLSTNPGFESRVQFKVNFPDYTEEELYEIFKVMAKKEKYKISNNLKELLITYFKQEKTKENFSNARCVRNLFEKIKFEQADRIIKNNEKEINLIKKVDVQNVIDRFQNEKKIEVKQKIGFAC